MTKAELSEWAFLCDEWNDLEEEIEKLECKSKEGRAAGRIFQRLWNLKKRKDDLDNRIKRIETAVDSLPVIERNLISLRYCERCSWREVADALGFSIDHVSGFLHKKALAHLKSL